MKKNYIIALALAAMILFAGCTGNIPEETDENSSQTSSSYSAEYLELINYKLIVYMEYFDIVGTGVDEQKNRVYVTMLDTSDEMMSKIENIIGKEGMEACIFEEVSDYPHTVGPLISSAG